MSFTKNCPQCGEEQKYKSEYYLKRALKNNKPCKSCTKKGKTFSEEHRRKKSKAMKGKKNALGYRHSEEAKRKISIAKGGDGTLDKGRFSQSKLKRWSNAVRDRDGCCQMCNTTENLHAHHIFPKALCPEHAYDLTWGIALCKPCHIHMHQELSDVL